MSVRRLTRHTPVLLIPLALCGLLAGCGQKGHLYLPDKAQAELAQPQVTGSAEPTALNRRS